MEGEENLVAWNCAEKGGCMQPIIAVRLLDHL
jgi:hypothetical protein